MKIISLNTWGGRVEQPFIDFVRKHSQEVEVFCFQEVNNNPSQRLSDDVDARINLFHELENLLPDHVGYFANQAEGIGMATFVKKGIPVKTQSVEVVLAMEEMRDGWVPRILQHVCLESPLLNIYNFHGVPKYDKIDTPERILQTDRMLKVLEKGTGPKILLGDFNLLPSTKSLRAFEATMKNLVMEGGFSTTRNHLYPSLKTLPFADYVFVSPDIQVKDFKVLDDVVSDHLPLYLEIA